MLAIFDRLTKSNIILFGVGAYGTYYAYQSMRVNKKDLNERNLLHKAVLENDESAVKSLLNNDSSFQFFKPKPDINAKDRDGNTPLHLAVKHASNTNIINILIINGANVNAQNNSEETPLHSAVKAHKPEAIVILRAKGADEEIRAYSNTPKSLAENSSSKEVQIAMGLTPESHFVPTNKDGLAYY